MGRDPKGMYQDEMDLLNSLVKMITWNIKKEPKHPPFSAYGMLNEAKHGSHCNFKIRTVKLCFVLNNGVHMHKDIDWRTL